MDRLIFSQGNRDFVPEKVCIFQGDAFFPRGDGCEGCLNFFFGGGF